MQVAELRWQRRKKLDISCDINYVKFWVTPDNDAVGEITTVRGCDAAPCGASTLEVSRPVEIVS